eukprot:scaffold5948_cov168-Alexandrium_tamarense.AAC.2
MLALFITAQSRRGKESEAFGSVSTSFKCHCTGSSRTTLRLKQCEAKQHASSQWSFNALSVV